MTRESYVPADTSQPLRDTTIATILADAAATRPGTHALVSGAGPPEERRRRTYGELFSEAVAAARALENRLAPGERLGVYAPSLPESTVLSFAAAMAGVILVPFSPVLRPAEAQHILATSEAAGVFVVDAYRDNRPRDVIHAIRTTLPRLREVFRFEDWEELLQLGPSAPSRAWPAPDDVAQIIFTSGTTGAPKGALLTHRGMTNAARFGAERFRLCPGDVYVNTMPLFHVGGQVVAFGICQAMATNVLVSSFEAGLVLSLIEAEAATHSVAVPTMLVAMIDHPSFGQRDLSSLRAVSSGGAVVPPELVRYIEAALGVQMTVVFGQTETSGYVSQTHLDDPPEVKAATLGHPLPQIDARVVDPPSGTVVPIGTVGELQVRGFNVMAGYVAQPDETAAAIVEGGWLRTGDLVTMDEQGYLRIAGRLKEMIITGGENIFPVEIEAVLTSHPLVDQAAVVGLPDRRWGEIAVAVVRLVRGSDLETAGLQEWSRERLAPYKVPKQWVIVDEMPLTAMGKVQKFVLRERLLGSLEGIASRR